MKIARLCTNGQEIARKNVFVAERETVTDSVFCRLYKPGFSILSFDGSNQAINVKVLESNVRQFEISKLSFIPLLKENTTQKFSFSVKNIGGTFDSTLVNIYLNKDFRTAKNKLHIITKMIAAMLLAKTGFKPNESISSSFCI